MESATILMLPSTGLSGILLSARKHVPEGPEYEKIQHYINVRREVLPTPHSTTTAVATSNLEKWIHKKKSELTI